MLIEAYVETAQQAEAAVRAGADRLELCGAGEGGLTPSLATLGVVAKSLSLPTHAMLRPRAGDFVYDAEEFGAMRRALSQLRESGAQGVVFGILLSDGHLDVARMGELVSRCDGLRIVCHRAFDRTPDADEALEQLIALGVHEVLTSGHAETAFEGSETLQRHVERAAGRIQILAGGGVRPHNAREIVSRTGVRALHARAFEASTILGIRELYPR